tara:strand:- start:405 stop:560 length:156 start_codon:yes stop_codon:yes gene_type:complete
MEIPNKEQNQKPEISSSPTLKNSPKISLLRKVLIGLFILGFWVFYYWFRET